MRLTNYIRTLQNLPVLDQPRTDRSEDLSRAVLEEIGVIAPYTPAGRSGIDAPVVELDAEINKRNPVSSLRVLQLRSDD
jgi:hypothetical protein